MISIEPKTFSDLRSRLAQYEVARARALAALKALPPTRPEGAARMWLPDEEDAAIGMAAE